jgi:hypothetical protein
MKIKLYSKIVLILFLAFFFSSFLAENLFLSYSPKIRPNFIAYVTNGIKTKTNILLSYLVIPNIFPKTNQNQALTQNNQLNQNQIYDNLIRNLKPVGKGVEAATYGNYSYTRVDLKQIEWTEIEITKMDGTKIKVNVPKKY